jgi:hypothetical protein
MSASFISPSIIIRWVWSWIRIVGFWYIGRGEAMGVILAAYPALNILDCIGGCEHDEFGLEYKGVDGIVCNIGWYIGTWMLLGC